MTFGEVAKLAHRSRVQLSSTGYYSTPKIHYDTKTHQGRPFYYFAYGAALSEVEVDTLTGEYRLRRVDILHDAGQSLNPAIDLGQVEGGFVQGMGWLTTEELWWDDKGHLRTHAPSTYKIPACGDIPAAFNVSLFKAGRNKEDVVYRSKAVGEPPLMLGIAVFQALRDAIAACGDGWAVPRLDAPATAERVLMAIETLRASRAVPHAPNAPGGRLMAAWLDALAAAERDNQPAVLVTVLAAKGSTPREAGRQDGRLRRRLAGTIGGGNLEYQCEAAARDLLAAGAEGPSTRDFPLGPALGQCCGGHVTVLFEVLRPPQLQIALFGAGHVGKALVKLLADLPCRVSWIDPRPEALPANLPPNVTPVRAAQPAQAVAALPPGSLVLVMTHDHQLDFEIVAAALRRPDLPAVGLIGSDTKRARFVSRLARQGIATDKLICPIGCRGSRARNPPWSPSRSRRKSCMTVLNPIIQAFNRRCFNHRRCAHSSAASTNSRASPMPMTLPTSERSCGDCVCPPATVCGRTADGRRRKPYAAGDRTVAGNDALRARRAVRRGDRQGRQDHRRGLQPGHLHQRSHRARRGRGGPARLPGAGDVRSDRLRDLHQLRALPDVPQRDLLGAAGADLLCERPP